jgi:uncharacterized protein YqgC (DUF456 family)
MSNIEGQPGVLRHSTFDILHSIFCVPMDLLALLLLAACCLIGLVLVPLGLPGLWVMVAGILGYGWLTGFRSVGVGTIALVLGLAMAGEVLEAWVGFRSTRRYGGSRRSGWGALLGGLVGAVLGVPVPVVGSVVGAFVGSFAGAVLFELSATRRMDAAVSAGWGAVIGRALAAAFKIGLGLVIGVIAVFAALRG